MKTFISFCLLAGVSAFVPRTPLNLGSRVVTRNANVPSMIIDAESPTIEMWMEENNVEKGLAKTTYSLFAACKEIAYAIRTASCDKMSCFNEFGDEQLAIDILANTVLFDNLKKSGCVEVASSEETPTEDPMGGKGFAVAFDPLDGSSIIDTNFAVGTICGIWPGSTLIGRTGRELKGALIAVYGPRACITVSLDGIDGSHEFLLVDDFTAQHGNWVKTNSFYTIDEGKIFAPGNLRATQDNPGYQELFQYWLTNKYQLRYTGGMVPDVNQIMVKGKGVFVNAQSDSTKVKLRLMYEVAPIGYLIEKAGGKSSDGEKSVLDIKSVTTEDVTQVAYGSAGEVDRFEAMVGKKYIKA